MSEIPRTFPGELQQIGNFMRARKEINHAPIKLRGLQATILLGLMTVIPKEIKSSGILGNPQRMAVINTIGPYQIGLNDRIDFEGAGRADISELIQEARNKEAATREKLDTALLNLPETESEQTKNSIDIAVQEIEFVEKWIREKRDNSSVSFSDVDIYRNLVNAIANVMVVSIVLGRESLPHAQKAVNKNTAIKEIEDKYAWVMGDDPCNNAETAVRIMHNVGMLAQIVDDWQGKGIDELLNIPSYASAALKMADGDKNTANAVLDRKKREYEAKVRELGLGKVATRGPIMLISTGLRTYNFLIKMARHSESLRKRLNSTYFLREASYMSGKLDKPHSSE